MVECTLFKSVYDNKTHRRMSFGSWQNFVDLLRQLSKTPGYKPKKGEWNKGSELISPAIYKSDTTRANNNVEAWAGWAALDIDDYEGDYQDVIEKFKDIKSVIYNSASSTTEHPKFRVIISCNRYIEQEEIKHFWYALNKKYNELGDPQTKDLSRMYYIPAVYPNAFSFFSEFGDAPDLNVDQLLSQYPYVDKLQANNFKSRISEDLRKKLETYQKSKLSRSGVSWSNYKDCPFVNKKAISEYMTITTSGWYHKMYTILCSTAANALKSGYDITTQELEAIATQLDADTGGWYKNRPFHLESQRALDWALQSTLL